MKSVRYQTALLALIAILPPIALSYLAFQGAINVPFMDDFGTPGNTFVRLAQGLPLSFDYLISQHNESRLLVPRLLFVGFAYLGGWDVRHGMLLTFLTACLIAFNVYFISRKTVPGSLTKRLALLFLANLLIFSPMQFENWNWAIMSVVYLSLASITTAMAIAVRHHSPYQNRDNQFQPDYRQGGLTQNWNTGLEIFAYIFLCTISTFSYANGLLAWLIVFPNAIVLTRLAPKPDPGKMRWLIASGLAGFTLIATLYFYGYQKPLRHPSLFSALQQPGTAIQFYVAFLGSSLGAGSMFAAQIIGILLLTMFAASCFYLFKHRHDSALLLAATSWVMLATYVLLTTTLTTAGRMGAGLNQALAPRYITFSLYFPLALIYLVAIVTHHFVSQGSPKQYRKWLYRGLSCTLVALLVLYGFGYSHGIRKMQRFYRERLHAKACLTFLYVVRDEACVTTRLYPSVNYTVQVLDAVKKLGFNKFAFSETALLPKLSDNQTHPQYGRLDGLEPDGDSYQMTGWAVFPDQTTIADAVVLAYEKADGKPIAWRVLDVRHRRPDVVSELKQPAYRHSGWVAKFGKNDLPPDAVKLSAWAWDVDAMQAFKLANTVPIGLPPLTSNANAELN